MKSVAKLIQKFGVRTGYIGPSDLFKAMQKSHDGKVLSLIRQGVNLNNRGLQMTTPMLLLLRGTDEVLYKYLPMLLFAGSSLFPRDEGGMDAYAHFSMMTCWESTLDEYHLPIAAILLLATTPNELNKEKAPRFSKYKNNNREKLKSIFSIKTKDRDSKTLKQILKFYETMHASIKTAHTAQEDKQFEQAALHFVKAADQVKAISGLLDGSLKEPEFKAYFAQKEIELLLPAAHCAEGMKSTPSALAGLSKRIATQMKIVEGTLVSQVLALKKGAKPKPTASRTAAKYATEDEELVALLPKAHDCK